MKNDYHILNGDALLDRIPDSSSSSFYVCREALIEGPIDHLDFFGKRAEYFSEIYGITIETYHKKSTDQFEKIKAIPENADINLWFEDDLFCQCNMWFVIDLLLTRPLQANIYLVRPTTDSWRGFGAMKEKSFAQAYKKRILLNQEQLIDFQKLWAIYSKKNKDKPKPIANKLKPIIPRLSLVIDAHLERLAPKNRPLDSLKKIITETENHSFTAVFKEFSKREGIYGFGDSSIKRMYDELMGSQ